MKAIPKLLTSSHILIASMCMLLAGRYTHTVDTFSEWCEQITGVDLEQQYSPSWSVSFSVSFDGDAIRDDYVRVLNDAHMEKVGNRSPRMAWRQDTDLHLINLSSLLVVEPEELISEWRRGIEAAKTYSHKDPSETCLYGTLANMFDSLHIHSMTPDALGINWTDDVTVIRTDRETRLGDKRL